MHHPENRFSIRPAVVRDQRKIFVISGKTEWQNDVKAALKSAGAAGRPTVLLLTDTQIKMESMLEDIDALLNAGEVPNLWQPDEKGEVMEVCCRALHQEGLLAAFINRIAKISPF